MRNGLWFIVMNFALAKSPNVWLHSRTASDVVKALESSQKQNQLRQRCKVELKQMWLPRSCFDLLAVGAFAPDEKIKWTLLFTEHCQKVIQIQKQKGTMESWFFKNTSSLRAHCGPALQELYRDYEYQRERADLANDL